MVGLVKPVGNPCIKIAIAIDISKFEGVALGVTQFLTIVGISAGSTSLNAALIDPHAVGLVIEVGNPYIKIAIAIEVTECDTLASGVDQSLTTVGIGAKSAVLIPTLVDPHAVGLVIAIGNPCIEITIVVEVA